MNNQKYQDLRNAKDLKDIAFAVEMATDFGGEPAVEPDGTVFGIDPEGIWKYAHKLAHSYDIAPEDGYQEIVLNAFEIVTTDLNRMWDDSAFLLHSAYLKSRNSCRKNNRLVTLWLNDGYDRMEYGSELAVEDETPELRIIVNEVVSKFDDRGRVIANALAQGYGKRDAGRLAGVSAPAVTQRMRTMGKRFVEAGLGPI